MGEEHCANCRFSRCLEWKETGENWMTGEKIVRDQELWFCRRYPPQTHSHITGDSDELLTHPESSSPEIEPDDWCGEWKPKEEER